MRYAVKREIFGSGENAAKKTIPIEQRHQEQEGMYETAMYPSETALKKYDGVDFVRIIVTEPAALIKTDTTHESDIKSTSKS